MQTAPPRLDSLDKKFTTTNLSVDDVVEHCYQVGYAARPSMLNEITIEASGNVAMAVQPNVHITEVATAIAHSDGNAQINEPVADFGTVAPIAHDVEESSASFVGYNHAVPVAEGAQDLDHAVLNLQFLSDDQYINTFDPTQMYDTVTTYNPLGAHNNGDAWDAYSMVQNGGLSEVQNGSLGEIPESAWDEFLNHDEVYDNLY